MEKLAEHRLLESEEKYRTLTETVACAIFIFNDKKILYVNPVSEKISGYSKEELLGKKLWDIAHPEFRELMRERALIRLKGGNLPSRNEVRIITKSGEERWLDITAGTTSYNGKPAVLATAFDITKKKHSKKETSQEANFIANANGLIFECNLSFAHLLGFKTRNDVVHAKINIYGKSKHAQDALLKSLRKLSNVHKYEIKLKNVSGHNIPLIFYIVAIKGKNGVLSQIQGTFTPKKTKK